MVETERKDSKREQPTKSGLEADIAYFSARICMLKKNPLTSYQRAQFQTYSTLESALMGILMRMEAQQGGDGSKSSPRDG